MSISNLETPNDLTLYCGTLNANNLNFIDASVTNLSVDNITENTVGHGVTITGINFNVPNNRIVFPTNGTAGIILPNAGGAASVFNYYEELPTIATTMTGPWSTPLSININVIRIGSMVQIYIDGNSAVCNVASINQISITATLPANFRPVNQCGMVIQGINAANTTPCILNVLPNGTMYVQLIPAGNWTNGGGATAGFLYVNGCYNLLAV